jgi:uncharacterized protein YqiB (DUF1249 family)
MRTIFERIYEKLEQLMGDLGAIPEAKKSQVPGFMDLNLDRVYAESGATVIALSHYYRHPSGDMIPDPDMEIRIAPNQRTAEALTYQDAFRYQFVYTGDGQLVSTDLKRQLNEFLDQWLSNCLAQGHRLH